MFLSIDKVFIMGRSGCGKSYLGRKIQSLYPRRLIFDTIDEYNETDGEIIHSFNEFCDRIIYLTENNISSFTLIFQFDPENSVSISEFNHMLRICFSRGNMLVVIEEVQDYASVHGLPHWLKQCMLKGRHRNLAMLFTSQRPGEVHKTVLSQCTHIFCGTITDGNDLRYLKSIYKDRTEELALLPDRQFLYFSRDGLKQISNEF